MRRVLRYAIGRAKWQHATKSANNTGIASSQTSSRGFASRASHAPYAGQAPIGRERAVQPRYRMAGDREGAARCIGLERLIARIRARAGRHLWRVLACDVTREQRGQLDALLITGDGGQPSALDRLRDGPFMRSGAALTRAVARLDEVRLLTAGLPRTAHVPPGRVTSLARFATIAKAQAMARLPEERRTATLLAFVRTLEASAQDDVLDLFDIVVTKLFTDAAAVGKRASAIDPRS